MNFTKIATKFDTCFLLESKNFSDERGIFAEKFSQKAFSELGISANFVQDNFSQSKKGVLRGLHFQTKKPQAKCVFVLSGAVYDVVVDIRKNSPTYGQWQGFFLSEKSPFLYIPRGFAHGFLALQDDTKIWYKCDDFYDSEGESGIFWNDPTLGIDWEKVMKKFHISAPILSEKDKKLPHFYG